MVPRDDLFPKIAVLWDIILALVEEDRFPFKTFGCPITKVPFKICWSFSQKEHDCGSSIHIQVVGIGNFLLKFDVN